MKYCVLIIFIGFLSSCAQDADLLAPVLDDSNLYPVNSQYIGVDKPKKKEGE